MAGKTYRKGLSVLDLFNQFPSDESAEDWFKTQRWGQDGVNCPWCVSDRITLVTKHKNQRYRCKDCLRHFSTKTGTVMEGSKLGYQKWLVALYLMSTNLKGVSSTRLARELGITQKSAWHLAHRIRKAWENDDDDDLFGGPVQVDETYVGGKKPPHVKGRGPVGKTPVVGMKDATGHVKARVVSHPTKKVLQAFVLSHIKAGAVIFTDEHGSYQGLPNHFWVKHSVGEYAKDGVTTNAIESFWSTLKRGLNGIYHWVSVKHLDRYVTEFAERANLREFDTLVQLQVLAYRMQGKRLRYSDLVS